MKELTQVNEHIYRLITPYKDIYTTVYIIKSAAGVILFDTASGPQDVEQYILPALAELNIDGQQVKLIFISHNHTDHAFGIDRLMQEFPWLQIVCRNKTYKEGHPQYTVLQPDDGDPILDDFRLIAIPGHTVDSSALLDTRSGILITGDCLQLYGIYGSGLWGANIRYPAEHLQALEKVGAMAEIQTLLCAHDYHPCGPVCRGAEEIRRCLDACAAPLLLLKDMILENPQLTDAEIAARYNEGGKLPTVGAHVAAAVRAAMEAKKM